MRQVKLLADALYRATNDLLMLAIDPAKLNCPLTVEDLDGSGTPLPHAYAEPNANAVKAARPFPPTHGATFPAITDSAA